MFLVILFFVYLFICKVLTMQVYVDYVKQFCYPANKYMS